MSSNDSIDLILNLTKSLHNFGSNLLLCPYSLLTALSMLIAGSRDKTREELLQVLYSKSLSDKEIVPFLEQIGRKHREFLESHKNVWHQASLVYCRNDVMLDALFARSLSQMFMAQTKQLDFHPNKSGDAVRVINQDVCKETNGRIEQIVSQLDPNFALLLIDAIHFKDIWAKQFEQSKSHMASFRLSDGQTIVETWMMQKTEIFNYCHYESLNVKAIQLPYQSNQKLAMLILLPSNDTGDDDNGDNDNQPKNSAIKTLVNRMNLGHLKAILDEMIATTPQKVELSLPRFKICSTHHQLIEHFRQLGIRSIFDQCQANLSAMLTNVANNNPKLYVSEVIQKAMIEVNEQGTEAMAITKVSVRNKRSAEFIEEMICDRPFMFMIIQSDPLNVLFSGILENPLLS